MKRYVISLAFLGMLAFLYIQKVSSCDTPIPYRIGTVDTKFGLSDANVLTDTADAVDILNTAEGKKLFKYSDTAGLTVNFVYDSRAELDAKINEQEKQLDEKQRNLSSQVKDYEADVLAFEQKLSSFNATVEKYNKGGGAPQDVYKGLVEEQRNLRDEATRLNKRAQALNLSAREYNFDVFSLNQDTKKFNNEISLKPEEGKYNAWDNTITLYFANNHDELIHTITHEFGHVLGMDHVQNPKGIMYPYSTKFLTLTPEDFEQLAKVCEYKPLLIFGIEQYRMWAARYVYPTIELSWLAR